VRLTGEWEAQDRMASQLQGNVEKLKSTITKHENDLVTLKARARTAASTGKINEQLAKVDSSGTIAMLEKMKSKVEEDESLAQASILAGDIAAVQHQVQAYIDVGVTHFIIVPHRPGFYDRQGLRLFAKEIMPRFRTDS
jgi:phage shock protein A